MSQVKFNLRRSRFIIKLTNDDYLGSLWNRGSLKLRVT